MTDWLHDEDFTTTLVYIDRDVRGNNACYFTDQPYTALTPRYMMCRSGVAEELRIAKIEIQHGFCIDVRIGEKYFRGSKEFLVERMAEDVASAWQCEVADFWDACDFDEMARDGWDVMYYAIRKAVCETPECMNPRPSWEAGICENCYNQLQEEKECPS